MKRMKEEGIEKYLTPDQIRYNRRKAMIDSIWPIFRFLILFGLGFIILYPMIFMISTAFRPSEQMNDPSIIWLPKSLTMSNVEDVWKIMDYGNTAINTVLLNLIASVLEVLSCSITGYGFARFKFKGKNILFAIVTLMIIVPPQIITIPLFMQYSFVIHSEHYTVLSAHNQRINKIAKEGKSSHDRGHNTNSFYNFQVIVVSEKFDDQENHTAHQYDSTKDF